MTEPVFVRIVRPYATATEYLTAEAETIDRRGMLLVDAEPLPPGTLVRLSVCLSGGEQLIKAEGRVRRHRPPREGRAGGLLIQFKRYGASTKSFIDEAVARRHTADEGLEDDSSPAGADPLEPPPLPRSVREARSVPGEIPSPSNRDTLLEKLRRRARGLSPDQVAQLTQRGTRL